MDMSVLDGEKAVTREEQAKNQPGINNANSVVGREATQPGINNANSVVGKEQIQPGINNANSMTGVEANGNSNLVPIAGSLYVDTETGETVDNYNYEGNGNSFAGDGGGGGGAGGSWGSEGYSIPDGNGGGGGGADGSWGSEGYSILDENGGGGGGAGGSWVDGTNVDDELLRSLIETTLNDNVHANVYGRYEDFYAQGRMDVSVIECKEYELTKREAIELYLKEQKARDELVFDMITLLECIGNPIELIPFFANKMIEGDEVTGYALGKMISDNPTMFDTDAKKLMEDYFKEESIRQFLHTIDAMHHDISQIEGGKYIEANIQFVQNDGGTDLPSNTTYLRLIDKDGEYVFTPNNPLSQITPLLG